MSVRSAARKPTIDDLHRGVTRRALMAAGVWLAVTLTILVVSSWDRSGLYPGLQVLLWLFALVPVGIVAVPVVSGRAAYQAAREAKANDAVAYTVAWVLGSAVAVALVSVPLVFVASALMK